MNLILGGNHDIYSYLQSFNRLHHFTDGFEISGLNRAKATYKFAGKGINVSRVLKTLDVDSTALGFSGGFLEILLLKHLRTVISIRFCSSR